MEFQFFNPDTGLPDPDLGTICLGVDALFQRIAYSFYNTINRIREQHDAPGSLWDTFQRANNSVKETYIKRWVTEAVEKVRSGDTVFKRQSSEALGDYLISDVKIEGVEAYITLDIKTRADVAVTGTLKV